MMPHLGVFGSVYPEAADEIFAHDCLVHIGHGIVPVFDPRRQGQLLATVFVDGKQVGQVKHGLVSRINLAGMKSCALRVVPDRKDVNVGTGRGMAWEENIKVGEYGLVLDGRNRPIELPANPKECAAMQKAVFTELGLMSR